MPEQYIIYNADKKPRSPYTGQVCDPHQEANRSDRQTAETAVALGMAEGVGLVFTPGCGLVFIDLDHCLAPAGWSEQAVQVCQQFTGAYVEVSRSGTGLHIIAAGTLPAGHRTRSEGLEVYSSGRYCALTGTGAQGDMQHNCQAALDQLYASRLVPVAEAAPLGDWTDAAVPEHTEIPDDNDLIVKMLSARVSVGSILGGKSSLPQLWAGELEGSGGDHSAADLALCNHLAFWTGKNCQRMDRLFQLSGLYRDGKWGERDDYSRNTILKAVGSCRDVYIDPRAPAAVAAPPEPPPPEGDTRWRTGGIMSTTQQPEYFQGCVYVTDQHSAMLPDGRIVKPDQFRVLKSGFSFAINAESKTTKSAWEAFTESQSYEYPKVASTCFRPELPPAAIVDEEGKLLVNTYVPVRTARQVGCADRLLNHVAKLLPDPQDRAILLAYMAAVVQYPGVKFQWAPLIQGAEGNGKTLLFSCIEHAVGRCYTHFPSAQDIANKFNGWLQGKLFIGVEEVYTSDRQEVVDTLKALITNRRIEVQRKGADQITTDNRANFMLSSNHKDAVRKSETDRRYCIFYTAQQEAGDIARDGMGGSYFPDLYRWLRLEGGYAICAEWLHSYAIPDELNPAVLCHRAPSTSSTGEAVRASVGAIEQEILEACEVGRPGFGGGWISSLALDALLDDKRMAGRLPRNRRREVLRTLGYVYHPGLVDGRINNAMADGGKPKLYIRVGHIHSNLQTCAEIVKHYQAAQSPPGWVAGRAVVSG